MTRDEIIAANPIADYVRSCGHTLKPAGDNFITSGCPVTQHRRGHRPVVIYPRTQSWACHDCKRGGSIFDWVIFEKGVTAGEAMRMLGGGRNGSVFVKTYNYTDEKGQLLFQVCRFQPKDFRQRQPNGEWGIKGIRRVLYNLPAVIKAQTVCIAEGEKDCESLAALGFTATTNPGGAEKWRDDYSESLRGKDVVIFGDNDADGKGERHTRLVIQSLTGKAKSLRRVTLPKNCHDISDFITAQSPATRRHAVNELIEAAFVPSLGEAEKSWDDALTEAVITSSALHNLALMPRKSLLGEWFSEGDCGFVFAPRGVGKTWFALALAFALSTGSTLGEWKAHEACKVLYADGEMPPDLMRSRIQGFGASNANFLFLNHEILFNRTGKVLNIANREVQQAITQCCVTNAVKVLFLDNLSTLASGVKENEADSWEQVNGWLLDLRRRKIAVVIVHHAGRSGEMRGTSKREDAVFWIIGLEDLKKDADDKRGAQFISHFTKPSRNTQDEPPAFEWHFITELDGTVTIAHKPAQSLDVFRSVIESGITKCDEIADAMKLPKYAVSRLAKKAMDAGWLKKGKGYEYALTGTT